MKAIFAFYSLHVKTGVIKKVRQCRGIEQSYGDGHEFRTRKGFQALTLILR